MKTTRLFFGDENGLRDVAADRSTSTEKFAEDMPDLRRAKGLSRKMLADEVGVSSEMIRSIEIGRRKPSERLEYKLRQTLV